MRYRYRTDNLCIIFTVIYEALCTFELNVHFGLCAWTKDHIPLRLTLWIQVRIKLVLGICLKCFSQMQIGKLMQIRIHNIGSKSYYQT